MRPTLLPFLGVLALCVGTASAQGSGDVYGPCPRLPSDYPPLPSPLPVAVTSALGQVEDLLASVVKQHNISGLIATVVYDTQTLWTKGFGSADPFAHPAAGPPTGKHLLRIASITKVRLDIVVVLCGRLVWFPPLTHRMVHLSLHALTQPHSD